VDPLKALEATMDGFRVMPMDEAAPLGHIFVTLTGDIRVLTGRHFEAMKDGAVVANSGHFDVEIDKEALRALSTDVRTPRDSVETFVLAGGKRINLLGEGRLINLAAAEGHPAAVMDMSFAGQALAAEFVAKNHESLEDKVLVLPEDLDAEIARLKLEARGIFIEGMTDEQIKYTNSWDQGT
jgi:adenosylhomocysteinase